MDGVMFMCLSFENVLEGPVNYGLKQGKDLSMSTYNLQLWHRKREILLFTAIVYCMVRYDICKHFLRGH